jgi:hypothetical protein
MKILQGLSFGLTDWSNIPITEYVGKNGKAFWRTQKFGICE